jgi:preprotein translocase subunit YajC
MIRPQVKQTKLHNELISNLKKGDKIIMRDGICGKIIDFIGENKILIESSNSTKITMLKSYISRIDK